MNLKKYLNDPHPDDESDLFSAFIEASPIQQASYLSILAARGESHEEIRGFLAGVKSASNTFTLPQAESAIDIVGTGGGVSTFNISTAASLIVASGGVTVIKHGGRSISSKSGSADLIEKLKIPLATSKEEVIQSLAQIPFAYLHAPYFNQIMGTFAPLRRELGFPTIFNIIGVLSNPSNVKRYVIGAFQKHLLMKMTSILKEEGAVRVLAFCSEEGMDEISLSSTTHVVELKDGQVEQYTITPEQFGFSKQPLGTIRGKDPAASADLIRSIFQGGIRGAYRDILLLNAAAGFLVADRVDTFSEGIQLADNLLEAGKPLMLLKQLAGEVP